MMFQRRRPVVGEKLICVRRSNGAWSISHTSLVTVTRVGRKYFYAENYRREVKFHLESWCESTEYEQTYFLYESIEEFYEKVMGESAQRYVRAEISTWGGREITHEQWLKIAEILDWDQEGDIPLQGLLQALDIVRKNLEEDKDAN